MQFLLTSGISGEKSNRATNMVYTNMLFALAFDRWIFDIIPGVWSLVGCGLILGGAIWVAMVKNEGEEEKDRPPERGSDEEMGMLAQNSRDVHEREALVGDDEDEGEATLASGTSIELEDGRRI